MFVYWSYFNRICVDYTCYLFFFCAISFNQTYVFRQDSFKYKPSWIKHFATAQPRLSWRETCVGFKETLSKNY